MLLDIFIRRNAQNGLTVSMGLLQAPTKPTAQTSANMHVVFLHPVVMVESAVMPIVVMHVKDSQAKSARIWMN